MSIVRNIVLLSFIGTGTGGITAALFPTVAVTPPSNNGGGAGGNNGGGNNGGGNNGAVNGGAVLSNGQTNCMVPKNDNVTAAANWTTLIKQARPTLQVDARLGAVAAGDIASMDNATPPYLGTVNPAGQTLIQRVQLSAANTTAASEIIIKGCYGNNTAQDIMNLINANPAASAILNQSNWTHFGISEQPDFSKGSPDQGVSWVVIFAQEG